MKNKEGQIWIETVIYILIGLAIMGLVLTYATPKIEEFQDKAILEQSLEMIRTIDNTINSIGVAGNKRVIEIGIKKGSLEINGEKDTIIFEMDSRYTYSQPGEEINDTTGRMIIYTEEVGDLNRVSFIINYSDKDIVYNMEDELKSFTKAPTPYRLLISNLGRDVNKTIIDIGIQGTGVSGSSSGGCVPESLETTCGTWECGTKINNCGENVTCLPGCVNLILDDDCSSLSGWTDGDNQDGESTQVLFDSEETFKFDSGSSPNSGDYASRYKSYDSENKMVFSFRIYCDAIGVRNDEDFFRLNLQREDVRLQVDFASDGLFINDGSTRNEIGTDLVVEDTWQEWTFEVDFSAPASATVDVYLDDVLQESSVDCSLTGSYNENVQMVQEGYTQQGITYVDWIKIEEETGTCQEGVCG